MNSGVFRPSRQDAIAFGSSWADTFRREIDRLDASRVLIVASTTLATQETLEVTAKEALGARFVGFTTGVRAHSPREDVLAVANAARDTDADLILAIGGGSVIDACKAALLCLAMDVRDTDSLGALTYTKQPALPASLSVRLAAVPTTLSGAEFTPFAGITDTEQKVKEGYMHPLIVPRLVILDPALTTHTPADLWNSTGIRAVDHAIEALCSPLAQPMADAAALHAMGLLSSGLRRVAADPKDLAARLDCQCGVWLAATGLQGGVPMGASHGIGHALGAVAMVPHGVTSCLMLPHVLRWNAAVNADRQTAISAALGDASSPAAGLVEQLVADLGLPRRLRDAGVSRDQFAAVAKHALHDPWTLANPRPIKDVCPVLELLEQAW